MQTTEVTTIKLSGNLGKLFGRVHEFYVSSPAEAVRALCSQLEGFQQYLADTESGREYRILVRERVIDPEEELHHRTGTKEIRIVPVVKGAKRGGLFGIILGVALVALAFWNPMGWVALGQAGAIGTTSLFSFGMSLALGGIAQMLSPQPRLEMADAPENTPNKNFSGVVNTIGSGGHPIPLAYGEVVCGSATISAGMYAADINN